MRNLFRIRFYWLGTMPFYGVHAGRCFRIGGEVHYCYFRIGRLAVGRFVHYLFDNTMPWRGV